MDTKVNPGERKILNRPTFLHKGIFVIQGSTVEVKEVGESITVLWHDREGNPHFLNDIQAHELS